jgi:hypothetical protein
VIRSKSEYLIKQLSPQYVVAGNTADPASLYFTAVLFNNNLLTNIGGGRTVGAVRSSPDTQTYTAATFINPRVPLVLWGGAIPSNIDFDNFGGSVLVISEGLSFQKYAGPVGGSVDPSKWIGQKMVKRYVTLYSKRGNFGAGALQFVAPGGPRPKPKAGTGSGGSAFVPPIPSGPLGGGTVLAPLPARRTPWGELIYGGTPFIYPPKR